MYHLTFDDNKKMIKIYVNEDAYKTVEIRTDTILGNGTVSHSRNFAETMNVLDGTSLRRDVKLYALKGGPIFIYQNGQSFNLRYVIPHN